MLALSRKERRERRKLLSDAELQDAQSAGIDALTRPEELRDPEDPTSGIDDEDEDEDEDATRGRE